MKGNNELRFNGATMCEIVQYYLTNKLLHPNEPDPIVESVSETSDRWFSISIKESTDGNR